MRITPSSRPHSEEEWRDWLARGASFGQLVAGGRSGWPLVVPVHFVLDGDVVLVHLARGNPLADAIAHDDRVVLAVVDDHAYVPGAWRAPEGTDPRAGVPTSYYTAVQLRCRAELLDDPEAKAELLRAQLASFEPGDYADPGPDGPNGRLLSGIFGLRLHVVEVLARFTYDDHKPVEAQQAVAARLDARGTDRDRAAAAQLRRRIAARG